MNKLTALLFGVFICASLTACGSSKAPETTGSATTAAESQETGEDSAASNDSRHFKIATDTAFKPFEYTNADGQLEGIDIDLLAAIAEDQGFTYEINSLGWDASIAACKSGQADGMIAGASITNERKESGWIFSDEYYNTSQCIAVAESSSATGFEDLKGTSVAVKNGTQGAVYAEDIKEQYGFDVSYYSDSPSMYQAVIDGECSGCFEDTPIIKAYIKQDNIALKILENTANEGSNYGFAVFSPDKQELVDLFNAGLANIKKNGKYDEIISKYLGE